MILELLSLSSPPERIDLVMGVPYRTDLLYHDLFETLAENHSQFHYHVATSREPPHQYVDQLVCADFQRFAPMLADPRTLIYVCGIDGMQRGIFDLLVENKLADGYLAKRANQTYKPTARCALEVY